MRAHTPGPWDWLNYPDGRKLLVAPTRAVIHCPDAPLGVEPADQALIAAAPEMFALLCRAVAERIDDAWLTEARKVIDRATGR